jgi:hypothetical protein
MAKIYKPYLPEQDLLLPPSLRDWLAENHLAYCVSDVVDQLDLSAIEQLKRMHPRNVFIACSSSDFARTTATFALRTTA